MNEIILHLIEETEIPEVENGEIVVIVLKNGNQVKICK